MALSTISLTKLAAQFRELPTKAAAAIITLRSEVETRLAALESGSTAVTTKANVQRFSVLHAADATAGTATTEKVFGVARAAGTVSGLDLSFSGAVVADDTNYATINVYRRTGAGAGTATLIATVTTQTTGLGNVTAYARIAPTATALAVIAGDRFSYTIGKTGTGVSIPVLSITVVETLT